ncbi:phosphatase PAP2 family protein [Metabacillus sp. RGM 3146]|uniref:phosphatase PAP2 family protein n=1 Tax=Metabacillus sp. RGM 3146 TaxID=3401092 RepID=UPI003B9A1AC4
MIIKRTMTAKKLAAFCMACFFLFFLLGWAIKYKNPWLLAFDKKMNQMIYSGISERLTPIAKIMSHLSEFYFCLVLVLFISIVLVLIKKGWTALIFLGNYLGSRVMDIITKNWVGRNRPIAGNGASFPSGHMVNAAVFYGFILYLLLNSMGPERRLKMTNSFLFFYLIFLGLVGWSRVYLKEHYTTDIIGGALLGFTCLSIGILLKESEL